MGNKVGNSPNIVSNDIIEYEGYEEFAIVEISNNNLKQEKLKPNPSLNNHSGGSSIGKYDSEHDINKLKDKIKDDKKDNEESNSKHKNESKFPHNNQEHINQNEDIKKENKENKDNNNIMNENNENKEYINNNEVINNNNEEKEKIEEDIKNENINDNNIEKVEDKIEYQNNNTKDGNENMNINIKEEKDKDINKDKIQLEENNLNENINNININKEDNITNEEQNQNQIQKEEFNNINNNNNNEINNYNDKNNKQDNFITNENNNENKENENINNNNENEQNNNINEKNNENENNKNKNEEYAPKKIVLPNINTIISEKVLEEGAGNELLFMSNLNKMVHISIKERVKYSEKFCITTKDNFLIYETRENYIKVKKPLAIIPINTIKNVVLFKLTKKVINYDHFYIEFQLDENNKNNVYNQIETFYMNDLDNNNENKGDTALVMIKTEEKNLAKKWYVLLKYLVELKSKN